MMTERIFKFRKWKGLWVKCQPPSLLPATHANLFSQHKAAVIDSDTGCKEVRDFFQIKLPFIIL